MGLPPSTSPLTQLSQWKNPLRFRSSTSSPQSPVQSCSRQTRTSIPLLRLLLSPQLTSETPGSLRHGFLCHSLRPSLTGPVRNVKPVRKQTEMVNSLLLIWVEQSIYRRIPTFASHSKERYLGTRHGPDAVDLMFPMKP